MHENNSQNINDMRQENVNKRVTFGFVPKSFGFNHLAYSPRITQHARVFFVVHWVCALEATECSSEEFYLIFQLTNQNVPTEEDYSRI